MTAGGILCSESFRAFHEGGRVSTLREHSFESETAMGRYSGEALPASLQNMYNSRHGVAQYRKNEQNKYNT